MTKCKTCGHEIIRIEEESQTMIINNIEYEVKTHDFNKKLSDIIIPKGWRLWKPSECYLLWEDETLRKQFNLAECWFYIQQMIKANKGKYVARFDAYSAGAFLGCNWDAQDTNSMLGVRFCRDLKGRGRRKK